MAYSGYEEEEENVKSLQTDGRQTTGDQKSSLQLSAKVSLQYPNAVTNMKILSYANHLNLSFLSISFFFLNKQRNGPATLKIDTQLRLVLLIIL